MRMLFALWLAIFWQSSPASPGAQLPALHLGMSAEEAHKILGPEDGCFVPDVSRVFLPSQCGAVSQVYDSVFEVFTRKTAGDEYQLRVHYAFDKSRSRLHPTARIDGVWFALDKPKPLLVALADISEAAELCSSGCRLLQTTDPVSITVHVFPESVSLEQATLAGQVATDWKAVPDAKYVPSIYASWKTLDDSGAEAPKHSPDPLRDDVTELHLDAFSEELEARLARNYPSDYAQPLDLGRWEPEPKSHH